LTRWQTGRESLGSGGNGDFGAGRAAGEGSPGGCDPSDRDEIISGTGDTGWNQELDTFTGAENLRYSEGGCFGSTGPGEASRAGRGDRNTHARRSDGPGREGRSHDIGVA